MGGLHEIDRRDGGGGFNETREMGAVTPEGGRERREAPVFPSKAPYVAFVGNFPFDASKEDVLATCGVKDESVVRVRPMTDRSQTKVRGYFVEVTDAETLREMLKADGVVVGDRPLRVNVAEERRNSTDKGRRQSHDRGQRRKSNQNQWTAIGSPAGDNIVEPAAERKKLVLKPRSVEADSGDAAYAGSSSIFGGAKPVDTTKVLEEVERKIDAELHREPIKVPTPKEKRKTPPTLKTREDESMAVEDSNVFSLLSIEDDE